jgi:DNA-binding NarL/FixJ family response regulator
MNIDAVTVLIADDGELFAESLRRVLSQMSTDRIMVCSVAHTGEEAVAMTESYKPDIVLMDIRMPGMNGITATRRIRAAGSRAKVIVLTNFDDDDYIHEALDAGASGYVLKDISPERLVETIEAVKADLAVFAPSIAARMNENSRSEPQNRMPLWFSDLSRREKEILACLVRGLTNKEISIFLRIAEQTVRNNVSEIYAKAGIHDRVKLVEAARERLKA